MLQLRAAKGRHQGCVRQESSEFSGSEPSQEGVWEGLRFSKTGPDTANAGLRVSQSLNAVRVSQSLTAGVWRELRHAQWEGELHLTFKKQEPSLDDSFLGVFPGCAREGSEAVNKLEATLNTNLAP